MAGSVNKAIIIGHLGRDPETRRLGNGDPVVNLSVATSESWRDKQSGERKEKTEWHRVVIFNESLAKVAEQYLRKGSKVYLEGAIQTRKWQDKDGKDQYSTEIVLQKFRGELTILEGRDGDGSSSGSGNSGNSSSRSSGGESRQGGGGPGRAPDIEDDIPFAAEFR